MLQLYSHDGYGIGQVALLPYSVDAILKAKASDSTQRTRAVIVYPMNALANSQMEELEMFLKHAARERPLTFARYTGRSPRTTVALSAPPRRASCLTTL